LINLRFERKSINVFCWFATYASHWRVFCCHFGVYLKTLTLESKKLDLHDVFFSSDVNPSKPKVNNYCFSLTETKLTKCMNLLTFCLQINKCTTAQRILIDPNDMPICECSTTQNTFCGPDSNCLNRMLQFECTQKCPAGEKCQNQRFVKREYAEVEPFRALSRGWGLRAKEGWLVCLFVFLFFVMCYVRFCIFHSM
jgi:hypothetical protein